MKVYQTNEIKNVALLGSSGSGKTTLAECMLFEAGVIKRRGSVAAKNTVSDYFQRLRMWNGITRNSTLSIARVAMILWVVW